MSIATDLNARVLAGKAAIVKNSNGVFTLTDKRWDAMTGAEVEPVVTQILLADLNKQITDINAEIANLTSVKKADLVALRTYLQTL